MEGCVGEIPRRGVGVVAEERLIVSRLLFRPV